MKIIWTDEAKVGYNDILDYLNSRFTSKEVTAFYHKVDQTLKLLEHDPYIYEKSKKTSIRRIKIHKLTTLYFEIVTSKNEIVLLSFHQNRQNPNSISF